MAQNVLKGEPMTRQGWLIFACFAASVALVPACGSSSCLNPQPEPPCTNDNVTERGGAAGAQHSGTGGSNDLNGSGGGANQSGAGGQAGGGPTGEGGNESPEIDGGASPGDASPADGAPDGGFLEDAGDADGPSDAAHDGGTHADASASDASDGGG